MSHEKPDIPGAEKVVAALGRWPSFHDAEIVRVHLERGGTSKIWIQLVGPSGGCQDGPLVSFELEDVIDLSLDGEDVSNQNVISALLVEKKETGTELNLSPCYGLAGRIIAKVVRVQLERAADEPRKA